MIPSSVFSNSLPQLGDQIKNGNAFVGVVDPAPRYNLCETFLGKASLQVTRVDKGSFPSLQDSLHALGVAVW